MDEKPANIEEPTTSPPLAELTKEELPKASVVDKLKTHKFKILGGVLGVLVFAGAIFGAYKLGQRQLQIQPSPTPEAIASPSPDPTADWQTYANTKYGYSIKYPKEWFLEEKVDLVKFYNQDPNTYEFERTREISPGVLDYPKEDFIFDINAIDNAIPEPNLTYKSTIEIGRIDGVRGILTGGEGEKILMSYVIKNGKTYTFYGRPADSNHKDYFDLILSTFKFLKEEEEWKTYTNSSVPFTFKYPSELSYFVQNTAESTGLKNIIIQIQNWDPNKPFPADFETNENYFNFLVSGHVEKDFQAILNDSDLGLDEAGRKKIDIDGIKGYEGVGMRHGQSGVKTVMFQYKEWVFTVQGWPNHSNKMNWFSEILSTFLFLD